MTRSRYLEPPIKNDLKKKMVFLGGPRQVGKTTLALQLLNTASIEHPAYLNWDILAHKEQIKSQTPPANQKLIVYDEIHKFARWRNLLKGLYDKYGKKIEILVSGSARLDYYRKGGDSLQGRYHYFRLHPFSLCELNSEATNSDLKDLLTLGGFPEPFLSGEEQTWRRWNRERLDRIVNDDIRDLELIREHSLIQLLIDALPIRVGSPLSVKNLAEDLEVSQQTVERWLVILENVYTCFRIAPFGTAKIRAVKKERKLYLWDWAQVSDSGARFENLVASQLLKYCHLIEDTQGYHMELRFIRDTNKREIDFVILRDRKPIMAVECKSGERNLSPAIKYFSARLKIPQYFQVHLGTRDYLADANCRVLPFARFCKEMGMP